MYTPSNIAQQIPVKARKVIYGILGAAFAAETALDAFGYGLVAEKPQAAAVMVISALGFGMAFSNTPINTEEV